MIMSSRIGVAVIGLRSICMPVGWWTSVFHVSSTETTPKALLSAITDSRPAKRYHLRSRKYLIYYRNLGC